MLYLNFCLKCYHQFNCHSVMSDPLRPHGLQHSRLSCPSPTPRDCSSSCPSSRWCHPTISSSHLLLLLPSVLLSIKVFSNESTLPMRWPKYWSFSFNISPSNKYSGLVLGWTSWILQSKGLSRASPTPQFKSINSSMLSFLYSLTLTSIHDYWKLLEKSKLWLDGPLLAKYCLCFLIHSLGLL